ncbi:MAG: helix-turn-helix transcriptional regulator [Rikenellaceae bacterium]
MKLRVKEICKAKNITLTQLAQSMEIAQESLSRSINGNPSVATLEKVAAALGVEFVELFEQPASTAVKCPHCGNPITIKVE